MKLVHIVKSQEIDLRNSSTTARWLVKLNWLWLKIKVNNEEIKKIKLKKKNKKKKQVDDDKMTWKWLEMRWGDDEEVMTLKSASIQFKSRINWKLTFCFAIIHSSHLI